MQNKVYLKDLSVEEIMQRLSKGEKVYEDDHYLKLKCNTLCEFDKNDKVIFINRGLLIDSDDTKYFLDEVKEPEADESCIGKMCYFWDREDEQKKLGILCEIETMKSKDYEYPAYKDSFLQPWGHCRPLTKEEALALVKE